MMMKGKGNREALKVNTSLTEIILAIMKLVMKGQRHRRGIESEYLVDQIYLSTTNIGDEGVKAIGEALKVSLR